MTTLASVAEECTNFVANAFPNTLGKLFYAGKLGNAYQWFGNAAAAGYQVSETAVPGWVVVYGNSSNHGYNGNYDPTNGHVAIVDSVLGNGNFRVSESNVPYGAGPSSGRVSSMADVLGFINPNATPTGVALASDTTAAASNATSSTANSGAFNIGYSGQQCETLGQIMSTGSGVAGLTSGISTWIGQTCMWRKLAFYTAGAALIFFGVKFLLHENHNVQIKLPSLPGGGGSGPTKATATPPPAPKPSKIKEAAQAAAVAE